LQKEYLIDLEDAVITVKDNNGKVNAGINMVTTILKLRAPGMTYFRMPVFCWSALTSSILIVVAFPVLTATFAMLLLDRYLGMHFFTNDAGGNMMMYVNLFWAWGHPEVYILILPAFGIFSAVIATFSGKPLFSYRSMVLALLAICVLSFMVWLHHFFTMGASADVNAFFGIMSMIIGVPTGVKVFNWLFTMFRARIVFGTPVLFSKTTCRCPRSAGAKGHSRHPRQVKRRVRTAADRPSSRCGRNYR
jgi:cytochrome o ubiquinol oxidase subunit 1